MKIIYHRRTAFPSRSANSINTFRLCAAFGAAGHEVSLFIPQQQEPVDLYEFYGVPENFNIVEVPDLKFWKQTGLLRAGLMALRIYRGTKGIVYGRDIYTLAFLALLRRRVVFDAHSPLIKREGFKGFLIRSLLSSRYFGGATVISDALREIYVQDGVPEEKLMLVRNAANPNLVKRQNSLEVNHDSDYTVGYVGHLYKGRGVELVMELARELPDVNFIIVGGREEDISYWSSLQDTHNVSFRGFLPPGEVYKAMDLFDLLIAPYQREVLHVDGETDSARFMSPVKLFEYMATGIPIITSRISAIEEILEENEALLCNPDEKEEWRAAIVRCKNDPAYAKVLGQNALKKLTNQFTWEMRVNHITTFLSQRN